MRNYFKSDVFLVLVFFAQNYMHAFPPITIVAQGCKTKNLFLTQKDLINRLTWQVSGDNLPAQYGIYRNAALTDKVAIVSANDPLEYYDHNRAPGVMYTYYIVGIYVNNSLTTPVVVTVTNEC